VFKALKKLKNLHYYQTNINYNKRYMVLTNEHSSHIIPTRMIGRSFSYEPCAYFDNFNCYISKESLINKGASFNTNIKYKPDDKSEIDTLITHKEHRIRR
jgi:hypothetical protein